MYYCWRTLLKPQHFANRTVQAIEEATEPCVRAAACVWAEPYSRTGTGSLAPSLVEFQQQISLPQLTAANLDSLSDCTLGLYRLLLGIPTVHEILFLGSLSCLAEEVG